MKKRKGVTGPVGKSVTATVAKAKGESGAAVGLSIARELAELAVEFDLAEVEVAPSGRVRVSRKLAGVASAPLHVSSPGQTPPLAGHLAAVPPPAPEVKPDGVFVTSPFVGTFYRAPSPDAPTFIEVGQHVRKGQVVCIVEAMKLMNEIESEVEGKIAEVLVKNAEHVEYGQPLFRVAKD